MPAALIQIVDEAIKDWTVWAIVIISFTNALPTGGLGAFSNIILTEFVRQSVICIQCLVIDGDLLGIYSVTNILISYCSRSVCYIKIAVC